MTQSGADGANLVEEGRLVLFAHWVPRGARVVLECEPEDGKKGRTLIRVIQESRQPDVDAAAKHRT